MSAGGADDNIRLLLDGAIYMRAVENARAVEAGALCQDDWEASRKAREILTNAAILGMSRERAAELATLVLGAYLSRAVYSESNVSVL